MESILDFLEKNSNALMAFSAFLTTIATFLIWWVTRKQAEISNKQAEITYLVEKAAAQPIITVNYTMTDLRNYVSKRNINFLSEDRVKILVIEIINTGNGPAHNLKIEQEGRETKEIDILPVGQKHEYFILGEDIRSEKISPTVKVEYQDIFEKEFTVTAGE